jgi:hypothetical protein
MENVGNETVSIWAREEYGQAELGDARRTSRAVQMLGRVAEQRAGKVTEVFASDAERKGAYRLLEDDHVLPESLIDAAGCACARRSAGYPFVVMPVDGSSATLADPIGALGAVGTHAAGMRGVKVISAIALSPAGEPLGLAAQEMWVRPTKPKAKTKTKRRRVRGKTQPKAKQHARAKRLAREKARSRARRPVRQKETQHWLDVIHAAKCRFEEQAPATKCWFQIDREADAWPILELLAHERPEDLFTVRASWNRRVTLADGSVGYLRSVVESQEALGGFEIDVPAGKQRTARRAHLEIRVAKVTLDLCDKRTDKHFPLEVSAVWVSEVGTAPRGDKPVDWLLLTNHPSNTLEQARLVVDSYTQRWSVEEVHKTWKSGGCRIEDSQLHTPQAVMKWATMLFSVAVRVERIKHLARTSPDLPASVELSPHEIQALILLKRKYKKRTETIPDTMPTIAQAARWIADLGGYTGKSSGGPFGSITLGRGLTKVTTVASALESLGEGARGSSR